MSTAEDKLLRMGQVVVWMKDIISGLPARLTSIRDAVKTIGDMGTGFGVTQNRQDIGLTTTRRTMVWAAGQGPTKIRIRYESGTSPRKVYAVVNATSDQHADNELVNPPTQDANTERYTIYATSAQPNGLEISSVTPIDRIDYLLSAADASSILIVEGA